MFFELKSWFKHLGFSVFLLIISGLSGCGVSPEQRIEYMHKNYSHKCVIKGYEVNSQKHTECMLEYYKAETNARDDQLNEMKDHYEKNEQNVASDEPGFIEETEN